MKMNRKLEDVQIGLLFGLEVIFSFEDNWHYALRLRKGMTTQEVSNELIRVVTIMNIDEGKFK